MVHREIGEGWAVGDGESRVGAGCAAGGRGGREGAILFVVR